MTTNSTTILAQAESLAKEKVVAGAFFRAADDQDVSSFASELGCFLLMFYAVFSWIDGGFQRRRIERQFPGHSGLLFVACTGSRLLIFGVNGMMSHKISTLLVESDLNDSTKMRRSSRVASDVTLNINDHQSFRLTTQDVARNIDQLMQRVNSGNETGAT